MVVALAGLVALVSATLLASFTFVAQASAAVSAQELRAADGAAGVTVVQTRLEADRDAQAERFEELLRREVGDVVAPVTTLVGEPLTLTSPDGAFPTSRTSLVQAEWVVEHADLVTGEWAGATSGTPSGTASGDTIPVTLPEVAAAELEVEVGDLLLLGREADTTAEIVGTWAPRVPGDPRWFAFASSEVSGGVAAAGPLLTADVEAAGGRPFVRWSVVGSGADLDLAALTRAAFGLAGLADAVAADDELAPQGVTSSGGLATTVEELRVAAEAARTVCGVALVLLAVIGAVTVSQVARLLAQARAGETAILAARGAAPAQLHRLVWGEAAVCAVAGTGIGTVAGLALGRVLPDGGDSSTAVLAAPVAPPASAVIGAIGVGLAVAIGWTLVIGAPGAGALRGAGGRISTGDSGRVRRAARSGVALLLVGAAAVSVWRFATTFAGPAERRTALDQVVAVGAPGLLTLALAVVGLVVLVPVWSALELLAARTRRAGTALALRSVARRRTVLGVPLLLLVVAVATSVVASGYAGSTTTARALVEDTRVGADARIGYGGASVVTARNPARTAQDVAAVDGVDAAALARTLEGGAGEVDLTVLALPGAGAREVLRGGTASADALADAITTGVDADAADSADAAADAAPARVAPGTLTVTAQLAWGADADLIGSRAERGALPGTLGGLVWLGGAGGEVARLELTTADVADADQSVALTAEVPAGDWSLLGVDVAVSEGTLRGWWGFVDVVLDSVTGEDGPVAGDFSHLAGESRESGARAEGLGGTGGAATARFTPPVPTPSRSWSPPPSRTRWPSTTATPSRSRSPAPRSTRGSPRSPTSCPVRWTPRPCSRTSPRCSACWSRSASRSTVPTRSGSRSGRTATAEPPAPTPSPPCASRSVRTPAP
ncbi:hypothetical protein GCM10025875_05640 [Litorihabitans aurantiacus]|uniref:ABC3 transporter permease C-terminal domain-containing protein n=2 Tax=Litorihabitans aurantiacus TaxID=1930061 RepID=A0AA37XDQ4_9MICO|nr:hypothetical protein GCM10025875_05640 [Litorihabitans aurantiacus]